MKAANKRGVKRLKTEQALVQVHKYNRARDEYPYYLSFYVDVGDGTTLQSIIEYIYEHHDQTLAYRNSRCNQVYVVIA